MFHIENLENCGTLTPRKGLKYLRLAGLPATLEEISSKRLERYQKDQQKTNKNDQKFNNQETNKPNILGTCPKSNKIEFQGGAI